MQKSGPVSTLCNPLILLRFLTGLLHHDIPVASRHFHQILVGHLRGHAQAVDKALLLLDFFLLDGEFVLHLFEVLGQEFVLLPEFLPGDGKLLVFFLSIYEV